MATNNDLDLNGVLNVLAGTTAHPLDAAGAACVWAGVSVGALDLLGALNKKAGNTTQQRRGFNAVCNQLAGTTNLEGLAALRSLAGETPPY